MNNKLIFKIVSSALIVACSIFIFANYDTFEAGAKENKEVDLKYQEYTISSAEFDLYVLLNQERGDSLADFINIQAKDISPKAVEQLKKEIAMQFDYDDANYFPDYVRYQEFWAVAKDLKTNKYIMHENLNFDDFDFEHINEDDYYALLTMKYDEKGNLNISGKGIDNFNQSKFEKEHGSVLNDSLVGTLFELDTKPNSVTYYEVEENEVTLENPKNVEFIYAFPKEKNRSIYTYHLWESLHIDYAIALLPYFVSATIALVLLMLLFPVSVQKECQPYKTFSKIKMEFLIVFAILVGYLGVLGLPTLVASVCEGYFITITNNSVNADILLFLEGFINVVIWMLAFQIIACYTFLIKYIFVKGWSYFKEHTIVAFIIYGIHNIVNKFMNINWKDSLTQKNIVFLSLNLLIIWICMIIPNIGFLLAFIYTIFLLAIFTWKSKKIRRDYTVLLDATKQLSKGNFNVAIDQNVGSFQSLGDEFSNIKEGFEAAVKEEVKSQQMKTELITNVSHDLKTPLTSIITYIDLLKNEDLENEDRKTYVETLDRNAIRLKKLIEDLFDVSKANSGDIQLNKSEVDVVALLQQVHLENTDLNTESQLDFKLSLPDKKVELYLDGDKMYRVFENLFVNIYKYSLPNTRVYIEIKEKDEYVEISFKNISAQEIFIEDSKLVDRFTQGDTSRNSEGSGLGLAIVQSFVSIQGGEVQVFTDGDLFKVVLLFKKAVI